jgi:hypothetical protein
MTWLRPVDHVRYVDPQRRYTDVLGPSWNAPFGALPHDDRVGTHDSTDERGKSYASIGRGQAALWITSENFCRRRSDYSGEVCLESAAPQ